jgi:hypothetical protein
METCPNCNLPRRKCGSDSCTNHTKKCVCYYDFDTKTIDKPFDFSTYCQSKKYDKKLEENQEKDLDTICCRKCFFEGELYVQYGDIIPFSTIQCPNCKLLRRKCGSDSCTNHTKKCVCYYDFDTKTIDKLFDFSTYCPFSWMERKFEENKEKNLDTVCCRKCLFAVDLHVKYGDSIPLISLQYSSVKLELKFGSDE